MSAALIEGGVIGFKLYMGNTFGRIPSPSTGAMLEAFEVVAPTGKRISLHAETNSIMERRQERLRAAGRTDPLAHLTSRPAVVAVEAVSRAAMLAEWTGARIHMLHISSAAELRPLPKPRRAASTSPARPARIICCCRTRITQKFGGIIRVNPPVREARNQEPLWAALIDGTIDIIATDHAPHAPEEKTRNDIWTVDCGFPGVETQMPLMLTEINRGRCRIRDYVRLSADNPARIWGFIRARARSVPAPTPTSRSSTWPASGRSTTPRCSRDRKFRRGTAAACTALPIHTIVRGRFVDEGPQADAEEAAAGAVRFMPSSTCRRRPAQHRHDDGGTSPAAGSRG